MRTLLKTLFILLAAFILLGLAAVFVITRVIDPNDYKADIQALVAKHTRGSLQLDGDLAWSFYPTLGVQTGALSFRLPEDGDAPFARLDSAVLGVKLLPLLKKQVAADSLVFDGLQLNLQLDDQGKGNWSRVLPEQTEKTKTTETGKDSNKAAQLQSLHIDRIALNRARIRYSDARSASHWLLDEATLQLDGVNLDGEPIDLNLQASLGGSSLGKKLLPLRLQARLSHDAEVERLSLNGLQLQLDELRAEAELQLALSGPLQLSGELNIAPFDAKKLLPALGIDAPVTRDDKALRRISLQGSFAGPANSLLLNPLRLNVDDTTFSGQAGISNLDTQALHIELKGNSLDADRYLAPETPTAANTPTSGSQTADRKATANSSGNEDLLPLDTLRQQPFTLALSLEQLRINGLSLNAFNLAARNRKGLLELERLSARLYEGALQTSARLHLNTATPLLEIQAKLDGIRLSPLLKDLQSTELLDGTANLQANLNTRGNSLNTWQNALNGPVSITLREGLLRGVNLEQYTCQAIALARQEKTATHWPKDSPLHNLSLDIQFLNGIGSTKNLSAVTPNLRVTGDGHVNLPQSRFDYRLGINLSGDLSGTDAACAINERYRDIAWPLRCEGAFAGADAKTQCSLDSTRLDDILRHFAREAAKEKASEKLTEKLNERLEKKPDDKLGNALRILLDRNKQTETSTAPETAPADAPVDTPSSASESPVSHTE